MVLLGIGTALALIGLALYRDEYRRVDPNGLPAPARLEAIAGGSALVGIGVALAGTGLTT